MGVVALVGAHHRGMLDHGRGLRALHQPLQLRPGRCLRHGHRPAQHLPLGPGRHLRLHVRCAPHVHGPAGLRRAVRHAHRAGGALYARLHEHPHASGLSHGGGRAFARSGVVAQRPPRPLQRPAANLHHGRRARGCGTGSRRAAAGHHRRHRHRGHAVAEVLRHQVLDRHLPGRRFRRHVGSGRHRLRHRYGRGFGQTGGCSRSIRC